MNVAKYRSLARKWWRKEIRPLMIFALVMFSLRSSLADWNEVPTGSMKPTILVGDRVFVNKLAYDLKVPFTTRHLAEWGNPQRGDIVVFYSPKDGQRLVKRVIGLPGDTVELRDDRLVINGQLVEYAPSALEMSETPPDSEEEHGVFATERLPVRPHAVMAINGVPAMRSFGPIQVPDDSYFMMGDNRDNSFDSRYFGTVARERILGRATGVVISFDKSKHWLPRWRRTFTSLDGKSN